MKHSYLQLGLVTIASLATAIALPHRASAQCVMNDTNLQVAINGSRQPSDRTNNVSQNAQGGCVGNIVNTTNVQVQTGGTQRATQHRESRQQVNGSNDSQIGIDLPPVKTHQNVQIDVDNPAARFGK